MNKSETEALWRALCATTCKPGTRAPYDSVCVHNRVVYATNSYVLHRVEGLFQSGMLFRALHGHSLAYIDRTDVLDGLLKYRPDNRELANMIPDYDPAKLMLALRPHRALGSTVKFYSGARREYAPLVIVSKTITPKEPVIITTVIQGEKNGEIATIPLGLWDSVKGRVPFFLPERRQWIMDVNVVTDLVSNVAFPIAAFVMMYYSNTKTIEELRKTIEENSLIMAKLSEKLDNLNDNKGV